MNCECLQDKTGSCKGCGILYTAELLAHKNGTVHVVEILEQVGRHVQESLCPEGKIMQKNLLQPPKQSIW